MPRRHVWRLTAAPQCVVLLDLRPRLHLPHDWPRQFDDLVSGRLVLPRRARTFANNTGQSACTPCPPQFYCLSNVSVPLPCPAGYFCPSQTKYATQFACPAGSMSNQTQLPSAAQCDDCPPGRYCNGQAPTNVPSGLCAPSYYCSKRAISPRPNDTTGGLCSPGYVCLDGSSVPNPTDGVTGFACPPGNYCPMGSAFPVGCAPGTYSPLLGAGSCLGCPTGFFCPQNTSVPIGCPAGSFCPTNTSLPQPCPVATYSNVVNLTSSSQCALCSPGAFCNATGLTQPTGLCASGYVCTGGSPIANPINQTFGSLCPPGNYCPVGSATGTKCPIGTYRPTLQGESDSLRRRECVMLGTIALSLPRRLALWMGATAVSPNDQEELWAGQCPVGTFCPNATALPTPCEAGHYCASSDLQKASPCSPGFYCVQGSYTPTPTGQVVANGIIGNECPPGTYCPAGTSNPIPCPSGTYSSVKQLANVTQCLPCSAGYSCPNTGTILPSVPCPPTVYCPGNNVQVTCPVGHYCPGGVLTAPVPCAAGSFANITGLAACFGCPARSYCYTGTVIPVPCPAGYYCPMNTTFAQQYPCLPGTLSNVSSLASSLECASCPPGQYCSGLPPTVAPTGPCAPGYYCTLGARTRTPVDSTGGICSDRFVCLGGASVANPVDGVTGRLCNPGSFCVNGTEQACPLHTYAAIAGQRSCDACPLGRYCSGNTSVPSPCPQRYYCPVGPPVLCPNGTYGAQMGLEYASQCSSCPAGMYCTDGAITGPCASGYFCKFGNYQPNPLNYNQSLLPWQQRSGGACPIGYYCTQNTTDPLPCPGNSSRLSPFGTELYDCAECPAGKSCLDGAVTVDCPVGFYCPQAQLPQPCPKGTFNPSTGASAVENCIPCQAGRYCNRTASINDTAFDCPAGSFCLRGAPDASPCPAGTYLPTTGGSSVASCRICPPGYECPLGSITPIVCEAGFYCPSGSGNMTICAPGYYCPFNSTAGVPCSAGYYCPMGAFNQTACTFGTYCPPRASSPIPCPFGSLSLLRPNGSLYRSLAEACQLCPKGTYGNGANCTMCPEGYVCSEGCTSPTPRNASIDNGYLCPAGYYCGNGTYQEQPCPVGTYNPMPLGISLNTSCAPCAANTYQYQVGQATCYPCSTSSNAALGSAQCQCVGQNRAFQKSDGYCICEPGYEYYDSNGILRSDSDDTADCQPVVYPRCGSTQVRSASGSCVDPSSVSCASACNGGTGTFLATSGICTCTNAPSLDSVCDSACRTSTTQLRLNPLTSTLQYYDPSTNVYTPVPAADQGAITGSLSCNTNTSTSCQVLSMQVGGNAFSGMYSNALPGTSRRRRLTESNGILNPMLCLQKSDSVLFSISGASYPVYMKDSLMNTNPSFDYGPFRSLQEAMASNASSVSAFAYTFTAAGTYVFALSNNSAALTIVTVMETGVKCPTDGPIVPMSQGNLIVLSAKPSSNIIMAPNWGLIAGLLCALFGVVAGMIGGLYYFRRKSWVAKHSSAGGYKDKARGFNLNNLHTKGSVVKKTAKAVNEADGAVLPEDLEAKPDVQASGDYVPELNRWDDDDLGIRELVDRLQFHHDSVEKAFHDQETGAAKMMKMLQNEADELKMLLASLVVAQKSQDKDKSPTSNCDAELVLLDTLQKNAADRADFVASLSDVELRVANAAKELHTMVHPKTSLASAIMDELALPSLMSPTFATLLADLASLEASVVAETGLLPTLQSEANRRRVQSAVWKAFGHTTKELLPPALLDAKAKCEAAYGESDGATSEACDYLVKFASVVPTYTKKLQDFADTFRNEWQHAVEQQNPALLKPVRVKYEKVLGTLLKELQSGTTKLSQRVQADQQALTSARARLVPATTHLDAELAQLRDHLITTQPIVVEDAAEPTSDVKELVTQLRALLANPGQLQFAAPTLNLDKLIDDVAERAEADEVAAHPAEAAMDDADTALLAVELRREVDRDNERLEKLKEDFMTSLDAKPDLGEAERESILDAFNEDMAHLQATLALEREKHQEQLRNRLAIRKLKKDTELEALLQDEALEEEMLEKQEAEMQALERAFEEEQAKIEAEFDFGEPEMDFGEPDFAEMNNEGDMQLPPSRTTSRHDKREDPVDRMLDSFDAKWREKQANLDDEHARAKQRLKDRLREKRERIRDPNQEALVHAAETLQARLLDRAFETQRDKVRNEALLETSMRASMTSADVRVLNKVLHDNAATWAARLEAATQDEATWRAQLSAVTASGQPLPPELEQLQQELSQALQIERDVLTSAQLLEKAQLGSLAEVDLTTLDAIYKNFDAKWKERQALQESDKARNKRKLMARLQAKRAQPRDAFAASLDDVTDKALLHGLAVERDALETIGALLKATDASQATDANVAALQASFAEDWAKQKQLLATETALKRAQLAARLTRRKQLIDAMPAEAQDAALAFLASESAIAERQVARETDVAVEALHAVLLTDKATLDMLSADDKAYIQRLLDEHATKWGSRQRALQDDHAAAKTNLARRLQARVDKKPLNALAIKALDDEFRAAEESLTLAALLEKAQVGSLSPRERATVTALVAGVDTKWQQRRRELDMAEATVRHELEATNEATPEALEELEHSMALQREILQLAAGQEAHQVRALDAALSGDDDMAVGNDDALRRVQSEYAAACTRRQKELDDEAAARRAKLADRIRRQRLANEALPTDEKAAANHALEIEAAVETRQVELESTLQKEAVATALLVQAAKDHALSPANSADIESLLTSHEKKWADRNRLLADDQALAKAALADRLKKRQNKALNAVEMAGLDLHTNVVAEALATAALVEKVQLGLDLSATDTQALKELTTEHDAKWKKRRDELTAAEADGKSALAQDPATTPERIEELVAIVAKERELVDHLEQVEAAQLASLAPPTSDRGADDNEAAIASLQEAFLRHRQRERDLAEAETQLRRAKLADRLQRQRKANETLPPPEAEAENALLEAQATLEAHTMDLEAAIQQDAFVAANLAEKAALGLLSPAERDLVDELLCEHETKWAARQRQLDDDKAVARAKLADRLSKRQSKPLATAVHKQFEDAVARNEEAVAVASLLEKAQLGVLTPGEKDAVDVLVETHDAKWHDRLRDIDLLEDNLSVMLQDGAARECLQAQMEAERAAILHQAVQEKHQIGVLTASNASAPDDHEDAIAALQAAHMREWARKQQELDDEAQLRRDHLAARLQRQQAVALVAAEQDTRAIDLSLATQKEALDRDLLLAKAKLGQLSPDDHELVEKLLHEHEAKWADRQRQLRDDHAMAKASLAARLKKRVHPTLNALATAAVENACGAQDHAIALGAMLEKAQLGQQPPVDAATLASVKASLAASTRAQLATLDALEAEVPPGDEMADAVKSAIHAERSMVMAHDMAQQRQLWVIVEATREPKSLFDYSKLANQLLDDHDQAWKDRMRRLQSEEDQLRARLQERLAKKRARNVASDSAAVRPKTADEAAVLEAEIDRQMELQRDLLELRRLTEKQAANDLSSDDEATIERLRREHAAKRKDLKSALSDEEKRLKASLHDRLQAKRDALAAKTWPSVQAKAQALHDIVQEEKTVTLDIEHSMDLKEHAIDAALLEQQQQLDTLSTGNLDDETIAKLVADHDARWRARQDELADEAKRLRGRLNERLSHRRQQNEKSSASLLEKQQIEKDLAADEALLRDALEKQLHASVDQLAAQKLAEKARLGALTSDDEALIHKIQEEHAARAKMRQSELDDEEKRRKDMLRARLAAKRALTAASAKPQEEKDAITMQLDAQERKEVEQIEAVVDAKRAVATTTAAIVKAVLPPPNYDSEIDALHAEHAKRKAERDQQLEDEASRLRGRLQDRLAMRKRHDAISDAEAAELQAQLEADLAHKKADAERATLLEKARAKIATEEDEARIRQLCIEHDETSKVRDQALRDEEARLKDRLQQRLAKKREKVLALGSANQDVLLRQLDDEEDREVVAIESTVDAKRAAAWSPPPFPNPTLEDHEADIQAINAEHAKHALELQRLLDEEEALKKARLRERMEKKRQARDQASVASNQVQLDQALLDAEMAKIEAEMAAKRVDAEVQARAAAAAAASAKAASQKQVEDMIDQVKRDHAREMGVLQESLSADRAKQELALKERIAARRQAKHLDKTQDKAIDEDEAAQVEALRVKLAADEAAALAAAKRKVDDEIAALQRQAAATAELQAHRAAEEKQLAESEYARLKSEHETEMQQLQTTLDSEQARQEQKLKDRIAQRRLAKEKELSHVAEADNVAKVRAALDEEERLEKAKLASDLAAQAEAALQEERERQANAEKAATDKLAQAAIEAAAATAAMDAFRAAELDRVSADFQAQMAQLAQAHHVEATTQKSKLEMRMAAKKQRKALELQAKKEEETQRLLAAQAAEAQQVQSRLEGAAALAQATALGNAVPDEDPSLAAARAELLAKQASEKKRLEDDAQRELELAQSQLQAKMQRELDATRTLLQSQLTESQAQVQVKAELDRVQNEYHEKERALTDSLKLESSQKKKDLMRRLEEKKRKKTEDLLAKQQMERDAQKDQQETLAMKLEVDREVAMIQKLLAQNQIVLSQLRPLVQRVVEKRHKREQSLLFARQYRNRAAVLRDGLHALMLEKNAAKEALLATLSAVDAATKDAQLDELDATFRVRQQEMEAHGTSDMEAAQLSEQEALRTRQVADVNGLVERFAPSCLPDPVAPLVTAPVAAATTTTIGSSLMLHDEHAALRAHLELEKQKRIDDIVRESRAAMQQLRETLATEWATIDAQAAAQLEMERTAADIQKQSVLAKSNGPRQAVMLKTLESEWQKQFASLANMLKARAQKKKERCERVCKRKLKRLDDDTKRRIDVVHAQTMLALTDEIARAKHQPPPPAATEATALSANNVPLVGFGRDRLQNAIGKARTMSRLGSFTGPATPRETQERRQLAASIVLQEPPAPVREDELTPRAPVKAENAGPDPVAVIAQKLDSIERLIQLIGTTKPPVVDSIKPSDTKAAVLQAYPGIEQDVRTPAGPLQALEDAGLPPRQKLRLDFGRSLATALEANIRVVAATSLPLNPSKGVFQHSIYWDPQSSTLYLRQSHLESAAELAILLVHTLAHLQAQSSSFDDDTAPAFVTGFYRLLGRCYQEFFAKSDHVLPAVVATPAAIPPLELKPLHFQSERITQRLSEMQSFLARIDDDSADSMSSEALPKRGPSPRLKKMGSSRVFFMANSEQQVQSLQECLDIAEKAYMETLKRFTENSDSLELLDDALHEAQAEGQSPDEIQSLQLQYNEAAMDLERVKKDRDEVAQRCEKLRSEIKSKLGKT
ncbi:hypothetical protein, variant [Saprolegnia diclina VS20]|uniref:Tyrosine-protein kinase ephrin type A/B receptor-like domain-containing protein n=1 Tax=Saprolegnia diclina (strain VS20) TaxID=1156394 RepID=T0S0Y4_SAPDV|nr:hypothetical protein, variant [Saprolegnia diclina VS20]EQC38608.1 hypothetical protein, variant [Saprolegnia diclina VS20]|eukprot:XP_008608200.1 hypothetical protein, variant [Saprolegnia diclina VS20]